MPTPASTLGRYHALLKNPMPRTSLLIRMAAPRAAAWPVGILTCFTWLGTALLFRISSLAALVSALAAPLLCLAFGREDAAVLAVFLAALIYWRHRTNIDRIFKGEEPMIGAKKT